MKKRKGKYGNMEASENLVSIVTDVFLRGKYPLLYYFLYHNLVLMCLKL